MGLGGGEQAPPHLAPPAGLLACPASQLALLLPRCLLQSAYNALVGVCNETMEALAGPERGANLTFAKAAMSLLSVKEPSSDVLGARDMLMMGGQRITWLPLDQVITAKAAIRADQLDQWATAVLEHVRGACALLPGRLWRRRRRSLEACSRAG